jgi:hypothetical protein
MLHPTDIEMMISLRQAGKTYRQLARRFGCHLKTVMLHCRPGMRDRVRAQARARLAKLRAKNVVERKARADRIMFGNATDTYLRMRIYEARLRLAAEALFDPLRDPKPVYADSNAQAFGDPPIGRRELLARQSRQS